MSWTFRSRNEVVAFCRLLNRELGGQRLAEISPSFAICQAHPRLRTAVTIPPRCHPLTTLYVACSPGRSPRPLVALPLRSVAATTSVTKERSCPPSAWSISVKQVLGAYPSTPSRAPSKPICSRHSSGSLQQLRFTVAHRRSHPRPYRLRSF